MKMREKVLSINGKEKLMKEYQQKEGKDNE